MDRTRNRIRSASMALAAALIVGGIVGALSPPLRAIFGVSDPHAGPGNAHRMIVWTSYEALVNLTDSQLDMWKSRGVDGFVVQTRYLDEMGGIETWTGDPNDPLSSTPVEGADVHERQRTLRDNQFAQRCHARGLSVYLGFYLSNYHNLSTPLKVWNDDTGWSQIVVPTVRGIAGAAKLLGMDGLATDSEMYRSDDQTWNWNYPGVTQSEATVRGLARQRGREFMTAVLAGFPNVQIINYRLEIPGDWEEKVQQQVNHVVGIWDKSVFPDFWGGAVDIEGFAAIRFLDPIFYKSWQVGSGWDPALDYNLKGVRDTLSKRWANWAYASPRFFLSPFAWIDPGPSAGSFDDARPPDYVAQQLNAFHKWGEGGMFGLYAQHINDFDYSPYVSAMQAASTPDPGQSTVVAGPVVRGVTVTVERDTSPAEQPETLTAIQNSLPFQLEHVADGLREPTDAVFTPDGRLFITERAGAVRIVRDGSLNRNGAATLNDVYAADGNGLLAIAIDPAFERTRFVYLLYTATSRSGLVFRLVRLRDTGSTLVDRAVLFDRVPAPRKNATASLRFGPDGKLYAAFDAGGDPRAIGNLASYNGKILRLNSDGTTPSDQRMATPVYAYGYNTQRGLDWQPATGALWLAGRDLRDVSRLRIIGRDEIRSVPSEAGSYVLPSSASGPVIAFYPRNRISSLQGDLLVAGGDAIVRIRFDSENPGRIASTEPLLGNAGGAIRALAVSPDGAIYYFVNDSLERLITQRP